MAKKLEHVVCTHCHLGQEQTLKQSFLGFYKFQCRGCNESNTYPLPTSYVVIYGLAIVLALVSLLFGQLRATILAIGGLIALASDFGIRRRAKHARENERREGEIVADVFS